MQITDANPHIAIKKAVLKTEGGIKIAALHL